MAWWVNSREIAGADGKPTGRWRLTAKSDEGGGGPFGDTSHDHGSPKEADECEACNEYISRVTGVPSGPRGFAILKEQKKRKTIEGGLNWRPMDTAPKDGTVILGYFPGRTKCVATMCWHNGMRPGWLNPESHVLFIGYQPTAWLAITLPEV